MDELFGLPFFRREAGLLVRQMSDVDQPCAVFDGRIPMPHERDIILERGFGLRLCNVPPESADLAFLAGYRSLTSLEVVGVSLDTRSVGSMRSLVSLELSVADAPEVNLAGLLQLRRFAGFLRSNESVFHAPMLETAALQEVREGKLPPIPSGLTELSLMDAQNVRGLTTLSGDPSLRSLTVDGARYFDLGALLAFPRLTVLSLQRIARVVGASALHSLRIVELGLVNCRAIDNAAALGEIADAQVTVVGKLAASLRGLSRDPSSTWTFLRSL